MHACSAPNHRPVAPALPLAQLTKPAAEQGTPCVQLLREEAVEVWKEYGQLVAAGEVKHY